MADLIRHKRSATAASVPSAGQLELGELAINVADGRLFLKKANGAIVDVTSIAGIIGLTEALAGKVGTGDSRLTDAREWTASTVSQAEAEAGSATTRRAWTAERVWQAVAAWWRTVGRVNPILQGETKTEYLTVGDGLSRNANSISGDAEHWIEITNNPSSGPGKQLFRMNAYGNPAWGNNIHFCRYYGTETAPGAIGNGAYLMSAGFRGWDGSGLSQSAAAFQALTTEAWSPSAHGVKFVFQTTPNGSLTRSTRMEIDGAGVAVTGTLRVNGSTLGTAALANVSTSGDALGKLNTSNTFTGSQTFTGALAPLIVQATSAGNNAAVIRARDYTGAEIAFFGKGSASNSDGYFGAANSLQLLSGGTSRWILESSGTLRPAVDNTYSFGSSAHRPTQLFASTATIGTSDAREKTQVRKLTDAELDAAIALADELGAYRWLSALEEKGNWARDHIGMTVQRVIEVMESHGLEPFNYGFICYDQWPDEIVQHPAQYEQVDVPAVLDDEGNELEPARVEQGNLISEAWTETVRLAGDRYSFRGEELQAFIIAGIAERQRRIEQRLNALEAW